PGRRRQRQHEARAQGPALGLDHPHLLRRPLDHVPERPAADVSGLGAGLLERLAAVLVGAVSMRRARLGLRLAMLAVLALPLGCTNPFTPATPAAGGGQGVPEDFSTPDKVLETMQVAIASKSVPGGDAWVHAFAESLQANDLAYRQFYDGGVKLSWE